MKATEKKKQVPTMPQGVWESSHTDRAQVEENLGSAMTKDFQGNGYENPEKKGTKKKNS